MLALWMLAASLFFATMAVCVKFASVSFNASELVFWRGLIGMAVMGAWARSQGTSLATRHAGMHAWRSLVGVLSLGAWIYAIARLPLATAMTLNYMSRRLDRRPSRVGGHPCIALEIPRSRRFRFSGSVRTGLGPSRVPG